MTKLTGDMLILKTIRKRKYRLSNAESSTQSGNKSETIHLLPTKTSLDQMCTSKNVTSTSLNQDYKVYPKGRSRDSPKILELITVKEYS